MVQILTIYNDEAGVLQGIGSGDKKSIEWVYKHCFDTTKKMVVKLGGDEDEAWDIFQDAVTVLYEKCSNEGLDLQCRINTYLTSIARNLWLKKMAKTKTVQMPDTWEGPAHAETDATVFLQKEADLSKLVEHLEQLGEPCSKMLKAFYFEKKSMQEISEAFGYTNADNAKTQKYKCLTRLKKLFFSQNVKNVNEYDD
jgi:RNA polymerase sigma factor (sigma-70 family)